MRFTKAFAAALCLSAAACGGGGSGSGGSGGSTPTPTPAPSPAPSPPPAPDYSQFDFSKPGSVQADTLADHRNTVICGPPVDAPCRNDVASAQLAEVSAATFTWGDPATANFTFRDDATFVFQPSERAVPDPSNPWLPYPIGYGRLTQTLPPAEWVEYQISVTLNHFWTEQHFHVASVYENHAVRNFPLTFIRKERRTRHYLLGRTTAVGDIPTSGSVRFRGGFSSTIDWIDTVSGFGWMQSGSERLSVPVDVDFAARTIRASATASVAHPVESPTFTMTLDARYDPATGRITGTMRSTDGQFSGIVSGRFYGPGAAEIGLSVAINWQDGVRPTIPAVGVIAAVR